MSDGAPWSQKVLRSVTKEANARIYQYSVFEDFQALWSWAERPAPDGEIYVIWDGLPAFGGTDELGLEDHLTVFDWVVGVGLRAVSQVRKGKSAPNLRVHILDAVGQAQMPRAFGLKARAVVKQLAPWLRVHRFDNGGVNDFVQAINGLGREIPGLGKMLESSRGRDDHDLLRRIWISELTRADLRHSVANAIGPILLARELMRADPHDARRDDLRSLANPASADPRTPFLQLLERLELLESRSDDERASKEVDLGDPQYKGFVEADLFARFHDLRFALVDDQCWAGYHSALEAFLLAEASDHGDTKIDHRTSRRQWSLASFNTPEFLLAWLEHAKHQHEPGNWFAPRVFGKAVPRPVAQPPPDPPLTEFDILFLDLRLFGIADQASEKAAERQWLGKLIDFSNGLEESIELGLPNQTDAFHKALNAAKCQFNGDGQHVRQLALLPILISLCDPTTPIVLFSSSQQRTVLDVLKPFPNIITDFAKPVLSGNNGEDREGLRRSPSCLRAALRVALQLHERRLVWELFSNWTKGDFIPPPCILRDQETEKMQRTKHPYPKHPWEVLGNVHNVSRITHRMRVEQPEFRFIVEAARKFCTGENLIDLVAQPAEFIEAAMLADHREIGVRSSVSFEKEHIELKLRGARLSGVLELQVQAARAVKKARNQAAHGYLIGKQAELLGLPWAVEALMILFLLSVGTEVRVSHMAKEVVDRSDLLSAIMQQHEPAPRGFRRTTPFIELVIKAASALWPRLCHAPRSSPEDEFFRKYREGDPVEGRVKSVSSECALIEIEGVVDASLYPRDVSWDTTVDIQKHVVQGQTIPVQITKLDEERRIVEVGMKQRTTDPQAEIWAKLTLNKQLVARLLIKHQLGCTVEIDGGLSADILLGASDLKALHEGDEIQVEVVGLDREARILTFAFVSS